MKNCKQKGYTLVEMGLVVVLLGIAFAAAIPIYSLYLKERAQSTTEEKMVDVKDEIEKYRDRTGAYPCPAAIDLKEGDPNYGISAANCSTSALAAGSCSNGICAEDGVLQVTDSSNNLYTPKVLRGMIPFLTLGMRERDAHDGYGNRISYAVTQKLTDPLTYDEDEGGIRLIDGSNNILTTTINGEGAAHFVLISAGEDRVGAYSYKGIVGVPCSTTNLQSQNCDTTPQAIYRVSERGTAGNNFDFDDFVKFNALKVPVIWRLVEDPSNPGTYFTVSTQNKMIGVGTNAVGTEKLAVSKDLAASNSYITTKVPAAPVKTQLCEQNGADCFDVMDIAGVQSCPTGEYMVGFVNGNISCAPVTATGCSGGARMVGIDANGVPFCSTPPPPVVNPVICPATLEPVCANGAVWLNQATPGQQQTIQFNSRKEYWECDAAGNWQQYRNPSGSCNCVAGTVTTTSAATCTALGLTGSQTSTTTTVCGANYSQTTVVTTPCTAGANCPATPMTICPANQNVTITLPIRPAGHVSRTYGPYGTYIVNYLCNNGTWVLRSQAGSCTATLTGCPSQSVNVCGTGFTLGATSIGQTQTITGAAPNNSVVQTYVCQLNNTWTLSGSSGSCLPTLLPCSAQSKSHCGQTANLPGSPDGTVFPTPINNNSPWYDAQYTCNNGTWTKSATENCPATVNCRWNSQQGPTGNSTSFFTRLGTTGPGCSGSNITEQGNKAPSSGTCKDGSNNLYGNCYCDCT